MTVLLILNTNLLTLGTTAAAGTFRYQVLLTWLEVPPSERLLMQC